MYLDPGFGSMVIQVIVAALAAGGAYLLIFKKRIVSFFKSRGSRNSASTKDEGGAGK